MRRRMVAVGAGALTAAMALAACGGGGDASSGAASGGDDVTLTFWGTYGNGGNSAQTDVLTKELIPEFQEQNPGITVNYVDMPYDGLKQKLTTTSAGGELPDLLRSDIGWVAQFAKLGVFRQLDGEMPNFDQLADEVYPGALATTAWDGHYYGLPINTNTRVLVTSQEALDAAQMDKAPATFDEFKQMAAALKGTDMKVFADSGLNAWNIMPWIWSAGGDITDADVTVSSGYLDSDASVTGVQMLVDLYKDGSIPNLITGNQGATSTSDGLPSGDYATILDGPWMKDIWTGQYPDFTPIYAPVPAGDGGSVSVVGGESIVISQSTEHAEAAYKFVEFTQSKSYQLGMAKAGQMTVKPAFAEEQAAIDPYYEAFSTQLETAKARLAIPQSGEVDTILNDELVKAFNGEVSTKEALTAAAKQIDTLLGDNN